MNVAGTEPIFALSPVKSKPEPYELQSPQNIVHFEDLDPRAPSFRILKLSPRIRNILKQQTLHISPQTLNLITIKHIAPCFPPRVSYPTPFLGYLVLRLGSVILKSSHPKKGVGYEPLGKPLTDFDDRLWQRRKVLRPPCGNAAGHELV